MAEIDTGAAEILAILRRGGFGSLGALPKVEPLTGGVSSDIVRVDLPEGPLCVKRARSKLKVQADWRAPVIRSVFEAMWFKIAGAIVADGVPKIFHIDAPARAMVMEYLDPADHPVWKTMLRDGQISQATAREVGALIVRIHRETAGKSDVQRLFPTDRIFMEIRLEPYLLATASKHTDLKRPLREIAQRTAGTHRALVHGDVSPKNILIGPKGPIFLDAECAWYGDPAFDLAFCLNHLLLKCVWRPAFASNYLACFDTLADRYLADVTWEGAADLEARTAHLLPALSLARIDGKSPVEYITDDIDRNRVRDLVRPLIADPVDRLHDVRTLWAHEWVIDEQDEDQGR